MIETLHGPVPLSSLGVTFFSAIVLGSLYALMAMGLTLIYSTLRILNFAHGSFYLWGAYIVWWLTTPKTSFDTHPLGSELPFFVAFVGGMAALLALGIVTHVGLIRPLLKKPNWTLTTLIITIAVAFVLQGGAHYAFGSDNKSFEPIAEGVVKFARITISNAEITQFAVAIIALLSIHIFLKKAREGLSIRAVSQDMETARLLGVKVDRVFLLVFGVSAVLAAVAGILLTNLIFIRPEVGTLPMVKAFIIIIFGGIGSVVGTIVAAFLLAFIETYTALLLDAGMTLTMSFAVIIVILIFRPHGLFGYKE